MNKKLYLRAINGISWLMVISGVALPVIALLAGEKSPQWAPFMMMAGLVGVYSSALLKSMDKRITALEAERTEIGEQIAAPLPSEGAPSDGR